jgi:hypothetical protein
VLVTTEVVDGGAAGPELSPSCPLSSPSSLSGLVLLEGVAPDGVDGPGATTFGTATSGTATAATWLVLVVVSLLIVLVVVVLAIAGVLVGTGSSGAAGFCHTDCVVAAPRLGKMLSRIAYAAPTDPTTTMAVTTATDQALVIVNLRRPPFESEPPASPGSGGTRENTGGRRDASAWPWSSQLSLTIPL